MNKEDLSNLLIVLGVVIIFSIVASLIAKPFLKDWKNTLKTSRYLTKMGVSDRQEINKEVSDNSIKYRNISDNRAKYPNKSEQPKYVPEPAVVPLNSKCPIYLNGHCFSTPKIPTPASPYMCKEYKESMGVKYYNCDNASNNYWFGAVVSCGGIENMPTNEDLDDLASQIYKVPRSKFNYDHTKGDYYIYNLKMDKAKAISMGFSQQGEYFDVWSNMEGKGGYYVGMRGFHEFDTNSNGQPATRSTIYSICRIN